jgi:hypothetical protein
VAVGFAGSQKWRAVGAAALLAAFGLVSTGQEAAHADTTAAKPGLYCGATAKFYGNGGGWTYAEVTPCLQVNLPGTGTGGIWVNVDKVQYYWGGAWYYPGKREQWNIWYWDAEGNVTTPGGESKHFNLGQGNGNTQDGLSTKSSKGFNTMPITCGTYKGAMHYHQSGPQWPDAKYDISQNQDFVIQVPCAA